MKNNVPLYAQIDDALFERLDAYALEHHISNKSALLSQILWTFFRAVDLRKGFEECLKNI